MSGRASSGRFVRPGAKTWRRAALIVDLAEEQLASMGRDYWGFRSSLQPMSALHLREEEGEAIWTA